MTEKNSINKKNKEIMGDQIVIPKVSIAVNAKCSQAALMIYTSSALFKIVYFVASYIDK